MTPLERAKKARGARQTAELYLENRWEHPLTISEADMRKITRGLGYKGIVTATDTGQRYKIYGASCGMDCVCAAVGYPT